MHRSASLGGSVHLEAHTLLDELAEATLEGMESLVTGFLDLLDVFLKRNRERPLSCRSRVILTP
jgi:hypothetical protein